MVYLECWLYKKYYWEQIMNVFYKEGHEIGFAVAHFLRAVEHEQKGLDFPINFKFADLASKFLPFDLQNFGFGGEVRFPKKIQELARCGKAIDVFVHGIRHIERRDGLMLEAAFQKSVQQVGWQANRRLFDKDAECANAHAEGLKLVSEDAAKIVRQWAGENPHMVLAQRISQVADRLKL